NTIIENEGLRGVPLSQGIVLFRLHFTLNNSHKHLLNTFTDHNKINLMPMYMTTSNPCLSMAELMQQMRDPAHTLGGSVGSIPQTLVANSSGTGPDLSLQKALAGNGIHTTPATNLKLSEALRNAQHDASPNLVSSKMKSSKSYTHGLSNSAGTVHIPTSTSAQSNLSLLADISPNHTHFFEVMYVGKIRVSHKRVPYTFIDDALPKFKAYDAQRARLMQISATNRKMSLNSEGAFVGTPGALELKNSPLKGNEVKEEDEEEAEELLTKEQNLANKDSNATEKDELDSSSGVNKAAAEAETEAENKVLCNNTENKSPPAKLMRGISQMELSLKRDRVNVKTDDKEESEKSAHSNVIINKHPSPPRQEGEEGEEEELQQQQQQQQERETNEQNQQTLDNIPRQRDRSASYGCIPPYVEQNRTMVFLVGRSDLRLISPDRKQVLLYKDFKDVASCAQGQKNADHFGIICREAHNEGYIGYVFKCQSDHVCDDIVAAISQAFVTCAEQKRKEASQIFSCEHCPMLWYHKLCTDVEGLSEKKTQNMIFRRIESLSDDEQDIIWAKFYGSEKMNSPLAEQNQFVMMLLRAHCESRQQRHVHDTSENRTEFLNQYLGGSTIFMKAKRSLTNSFDHLLKRKASKDDVGNNSLTALTIKEQNIRESSAEPLKSSGTETPPEGFRSRSNTIGSSPCKPSADQLKSPMMDIFLKVGNSPKETEAHQGSWRQAILNSVVTPSKGLENTEQGEYLSPMRITRKYEWKKFKSESIFQELCISILDPQKGKRTREQLRELWKTAIRQTILLNRMETENAMLQARQNENELKRMKLDYDEIVICDKQLIERWDSYIERDALKVGNKRDPKILAQAIKTGVPRTKRGDVWLFLAEQYTTNSAPPIDTHRFPNFHTPYQALLKNLTEHQHAIFIDLGRTFPNHKFYKDPLGLGQLSLFNLLKAYSILDPELGYCQGLGFICGILLLHCDEAEAFHLLKHLMFHRQMRCKYLPDMKKFQLQLYQLSRLVKDHLPDLYIWLDQNDVSPTLYAAPWILTVFSSQFPLGFVARVFDLLFLESSEVIFKFALALLTVHKNQLLLRDNFEEIMDYLKKEITTTNHHLEMLKQEKSKNQHLEQQLQFAQSSIAQLEKTRNSQQTHITNLQSQVQSLELTIQTLGRYVTQLSEQNTDLDVPSEVRRILQHLEDLEKQKRKPFFTERKIGKSASVNSHLGFPLKVLEELNERDEHGSPQKPKKEKIPFFEHTYEQLRQQRLARYDNHTSNGNNELSSSPSGCNSPQQRPQTLYDSRAMTSLHEMPARLDDLKLPEQVDRFIANIKSPIEVDSGVGTPLSPPSTSSNFSQSSAGSLFSRMGYKTTPTILSPLAARSQMIDTARSQQLNSNNLNDVPNKAKNPDTLEPNDLNTEQASMHPLGVVGEVNVKFNGTTQLKSLKPMHHLKVTIAPTTTSTTDREEEIKKAENMESKTLTSMTVIAIKEDEEQRQQAAINTEQWSGTS
uniref:Rab-GAP TBC domain-containing protein n=1 Tax=Glossina palpalis gambiensis TaxID=67801 RepID=A0A1B0AZR2_9MUSC